MASQVLYQTIERCVSVPSIAGPVFNITKVNRLHMGAYLCVATNGVQPAVSKRIMLTVHCKFLSTFPTLTTRQYLTFVTYDLDVLFSWIMKKKQ
jgi:hypothetical protein